MVYDEEVLENPILKGMPGSAEFHAAAFEAGLRFGYLFGAGKYKVSLFSRNLTDAKIVQNGIDFDNLTGMTNDPRITGVDFTIRF